MAVSDILTFSTGTKMVVDSTGILTTAAANTPAYDYSSGRRRLLIEAAAATNDLLHSGDLSASAWLKSAGLTLAATVAAPDGTLSARCFEGSAANVYQFAATPVGPQVHSIWVRRHVVPSVTVYLWEAGIGFVSNVGLDFTTGALTTQSGPGGATAVAHADGWWRVSVPWTSTAGSVALGVYSDAGFCAWGAQSEVGNAASSYVPTTSAAATRIADDVRLSAAVRALIADAGYTLVLRGGFVGSPGKVIGSTTSYAGVVGYSGNYVGVFDSALNADYAGAASSGPTNPFGIAVSATGSSRSVNVNGGATVSSAHSLFTAADTALRIAGGYGGNAANLLLDELVIWPFVGSDAGIQAQARIYA